MHAYTQFAVVTFISFFYTLPIALILEGGKIGAGLAAVSAAGWSNTKLAQVISMWSE
jgi:hypothetical protein